MQTAKTVTEFSNDLVRILRLSIWEKAKRQRQQSKETKGDSSVPNVSQFARFCNYRESVSVRNVLTRMHNFAIYWYQQWLQPKWLYARLFAPIAA